MSNKQIVLLFLGFFFLHFLVSYIAGSFISYLGFFPYKDVLLKTHLPQFIYSFANFDGVHYLKIAQYGYRVNQFAQAFFPLYPVSINLLAKTTLPWFWAGFLISNLSFVVSLVCLNNYLNTFLKDKKTIIWFYLIFLAFPSSFFFTALYTEGLFLLLLTATLYFLRKENYVLAAVCGYLAALTRFIGVFLVIPIFFHIGSKYFLKKISPIKFFRENLYVFIALLTPVIGSVTYAVYLWRTTGDPLFFFHSQPIFGAQRSTNLILPPQVIFRYIKIFVTAQHNFQYFVSVVEFGIFILVTGVLLWDLWKVLHEKRDSLWADRLGLNLFSWVNILLPTLTGTLSSIPRYALFSLSFFIVLAQLRSKLLKISLSLIFVILQIILLMYFVQGYFVS